MYNSSGGHSSLSLSGSEEEGSSKFTYWCQDIVYLATAGPELWVHSDLNSSSPISTSPMQPAVRASYRGFARTSAPFPVLTMMTSRPNVAPCKKKQANPPSQSELGMDVMFCKLAKWNSRGGMYRCEGNPWQHTCGHTVCVCVWFRLAAIIQRWQLTTSVW